MYGNLKKVILYLFATSMAEVLVLLLALVLGPPADLLPIVAVASLVLWTEEARKLFVRIRRTRGT